MKTFKLDMTATTLAEGMITDPNTGQRTHGNFNVKLAKTAYDTLSRTRNFTEAKAVYPLLEKIKPFIEDDTKTGTISVTEAEFQMLYSVFVNRRTEEKIDFANMVESGNKGFTFEEYETELAEKQAAIQEERRKQQLAASTPSEESAAE